MQPSLESPLQSFRLRHEFSGVASMTKFSKQSDTRKIQERVFCAVSLQRSREDMDVSIGTFGSKNMKSWFVDATCSCKMSTTSGSGEEKVLKEFPPMKLPTETAHLSKFTFSTNFEEMKEKLGNGVLVVEFSVEDIVQSINDATVVVDGREISVHKPFLASQSTYFQDTFFMLESFNQPPKVTLYEATFDNFQLFLGVLNKKETIDDQNVEILLKIAERYQFKSVILDSETFLIEESKKKIYEKLEISEKYKLDILKTHINNLMSDKCIISTDSLRCTVCYQIFRGTPQILACGHSFCSSCIDSCAEQQFNLPATHCPMCRKKVHFHMAKVNFTLKTILESVEVFEEEPSEDIEEDV